MIEDKQRLTELLYLRFRKDITGDLVIDRDTTPIIEKEFANNELSIDSLLNELKKLVKLKKFNVREFSSKTSYNNIEFTTYIVPKGYPEELAYLESNFRRGEEAYEWLERTHQGESIILETISRSNDPSFEFSLFLEMWKSGNNIEEAKSDKFFYFSYEELSELQDLLRKSNGVFSIGEKGSPNLYKRVTKDDEIINSEVNRVISAVENPNTIRVAEETFGLAKINKEGKDYYLHSRDGELFMAETITDKRRTPLDNIFSYQELIELGLTYQITFIPTLYKGKVEISEEQIKEVNFLYKEFKDPMKSIDICFSNKGSYWYNEFRFDFHSAAYKFIVFFNRVKKTEEL